MALFHVTRCEARRALTAPLFAARCMHVGKLVRRVQIVFSGNTGIADPFADHMKREPVDRLAGAKMLAVCARARDSVDHRRSTRSQVLKQFWPGLQASPLNDLDQLCLQVLAQHALGSLNP